jgi:hypothetical protein
MSTLRAVALVSLLAIVPGLGSAQSPDPAAERARLGNERIQAEAERVAREELERQNQAAAASSAPPSMAPNAAGTAPTRPPPAGASAPPPRPPAAADRTAQGMDQLRELGRLKDAGYLTEAEFQRVKQKILDSYF